MNKPKNTLNLSLDKVIEAAEGFARSGDRKAAIALYLSWIRQNPRSPRLYVALFNCGYLLSSDGQYERAIESYNAAIKLNPKLFQASINLGFALEKLGRYDEAIEKWKKVVERSGSTVPLDTLVLTLNNLGRTLELTKQWSDSLKYLKRSLALNSKQDKVIYTVLRHRQRICEWPIYTPLPGIKEQQFHEQASALSMLAISDDPETQQIAALRNARDYQNAETQEKSPGYGHSHSRIRVGYVSSNFNLHPVAMLTAELYELHDRDRFEIYGFSWTPKDGSPMLARVQNAIDHFFEIHSLSDSEACQLIRDHEIDVLVDLQGLTTGARPGIFSKRPAPYQISYLGHPGTASVPGVDYIIADKYLMPEDAIKYYSEKPLFMPSCYQVNDRKRPRPLARTRSEYGLPEGSHILCAFNNTNKITPEIFDSWQRIVARVPRSVLWLLAENSAAEENLRRRWIENGGDLNKLIFSPMMQYEDYLSKLAAADIFLDTFPFNGGTTTSDCLWMGVPVITCSGKSFASRMSGSLLNAIGMSELIGTTIEEYEALCCRTLLVDGLLNELKNKLQVNRSQCVLFDTPSQVKGVERLYASLC